MLSPELKMGLVCFDPLLGRLGRPAAGRVSVREKPMGVPKDWGIFRAEPAAEPLAVWGLEQSGVRQKKPSVKICSSIAKRGERSVCACVNV